jgi:DNA helicase-2/ATP-dependent DNA helicase PcrA
LPYIVVGGMSFYKRKEIKDVVAYLQILINPFDNISALRIVNEPPRGIGETTINRVLEFSEKHNISFLEAFDKVSVEQVKLKKPLAKIRAFNNLISKHTELNNQNANPEHIKKYIEATGILDYYQEIDDADSRDRIANIEQLLTDVIMFIYSKSDNTLRDYLEQISLISDLDAKELSEDRLTLMTLHSA